MRMAPCRWDATDESLISVATADSGAAFGVVGTDVRHRGPGGDDEDGIRRTVPAIWRASPGMRPWRSRRTW
ncbi:hypothetical protein [Streptomyces atroolivaceus]|uniref:hypothetical protein n=1 Tax=Streptomyces atroolivaceus TaxID=66869 RepID=UPI003678CFA1